MIPLPGQRLEVNSLLGSEDMAGGGKDGRWMTLVVTGITKR